MHYRTLDVEPSIMALAVVFGVSRKHNECQYRPTRLPLLALAFCLRPVKATECCMSTSTTHFTLVCHITRIEEIYGSARLFESEDHDRSPLSMTKPLLDQINFLPPSFALTVFSVQPSISAIPVASTFDATNTGSCNYRDGWHQPPPQEPRSR